MKPPGIELSAVSKEESQLGRSKRFDEYFTVASRETFDVKSMSIKGKPFK
jgi:hypothetical protein